MREEASLAAAYRGCRPSALDRLVALDRDGAIGLGVAVSIVASCEYYRFVSMSKQGRAYTPRTALLAVVVAAILAVLGIVMALYLVLISQ